VHPSIATVNVWLLEVASLLQRSIQVAIVGPSIVTLTIVLLQFGDSIATPTILLV